MTVYRQVYDFGHLRAVYTGPRQAPDVRTLTLVSSMGLPYLA